MNSVIQALLASIMGASHGWLCSWTVSVRCVFGWLRIRLGRLRDGLCRLRHLAAHHHAHSDDGADRRLRPLHAGLRRLEAAADIELADGRAVHRRRDDRRPARGCAAHLSRSGLCAPRRRRAAGHLQRVWPGQTGLQAAQGRHRHRRQHRIPERRAGWVDRAAGLHHHDLVPDAGLDARTNSARCSSPSFSRE